MTKPKKYTITAALPYANGALHLGHLAGAYLPADIYARTLRLLGKDVVFVCGSDEHGAAITIRAKKEGLSPKDIIDKYHALNKNTFEQLGISFDIYHRTSDPLHHQTAQDFFSRLLAQGQDLSVKSSEQYFDEDYQQFLADRYIIGTCPKCGHEEAYGDQCEKCGSTLSPTDLLHPRSTLSNKAPILKATDHWYFHLERHADWLRTWIQQGQLDGHLHHDPETWRKHVVGQCLSWLDGGLQARAITRDLDWGIPVPVEGAQGKVLYVWFDAPIGYISATKAWAEAQGKDWKEYWMGEDVELLHFIGKDNIVFHCIVFPAMLKAHGQFALPKNVPANQFLNLEGKKFSKSKGWVIEQHQYLADFQDFPNKEDALRYALIRTMPENKDGDFKWHEFVDLHDGELADTLGNFFNRVATFTEKYFEGKVPAAQAHCVIKGTEEGQEITYLSYMEGLRAQLQSWQELVLAHQYRDAVQAMMDFARQGNALLQYNEPWKRHKVAPQAPEIAVVVALGLQIAAVLSVIAQPFLPFTAAKMRRILGLAPLQQGDLAQLFQSLANGQGAIPTGHVLGEKTLLFGKIQDRNNPQYLQLIQQQKQALLALASSMENQTPPTPPAPQVEEPSYINIDDFAKVQLKVATIIEATKVPKADKLLQLTLDLGTERRTVLSGIAEHYNPEQVIGQQVILVANLAPRKMRGIESQGMILMASDASGKLLFVQPKELCSTGAEVR
jgi:methionyl-tRNA synthetase